MCHEKRANLSYPIFRYRFVGAKSDDFAVESNSSLVGMLTSSSFYSFSYEFGGSEKTVSS